MKVLLLTDSYPPEIRSAAILMQELAQGLAARGHKVWVCTLQPRYNLAAGLRYGKPPPEKNVRILRVNSLPVHNTPLWLRGLGELTLPWLFFARSAAFVNPDVVAIYSPPLTLGLAGAAFKSVRHAGMVLNVQDLFPQHAIDAGVLKCPFIISFYRRLENFLYRAAHTIAVHSPGNRNFLMEQRQVPPEKIAVIPNWVDPTLPQRCPPLNFKKNWHLEHKFVLLFGGVLGPTQGLELVIAAADRLRHHHDLVFLLVGDGAARRRLEQEVKQKRLSNVWFRPFLDPAQYQALLAEVDVCFLTLSPAVKTPVVPSKLLGYMAAGKPYVAALNAESDAVAITLDSGAGLVVPAGDPQSFSQAVLTLYRDKTLAQRMGRRGRDYVQTHFSKKNCLDRYEALLLRCTAVTSRGPTGKRPKLCSLPNWGHIHAEALPPFPF
jgi:colanic acid biosynthesis glycosyl transferase WcaI